ncbi:hypothetical protein [Agreia bicolorata]|uniref:Uncharacterized protein n=1 Tax=Agreia bicolorata TaxID=110935 RepID=A0ABR5CJH4_9MICO|nr:hypothetical protein [Agreia bicolorata]KJC65729.1 hypothetical protein TZ00_02820 [Agreia bicolorata]
MNEISQQVRDAILAARAGDYIQRQADEDAEEAAQGRIVGLLNGWRNAMADRDGAMARNDGSDLRLDELRVPKLAINRRSSETRDHPPEHVTAPEQADHAIGTYHNLMMGLDAMVVDDDRAGIKLHLTSEYVIVRALIEAATTALWILGPDDSDTRVERALRLRHDELMYSKNLAKNYARYSHALNGDEYRAQEKYVAGQVSDLKTLTADAGLDFARVIAKLSPSTIAAEGGVYVPELGGAMTYWYWSTASSLAHGEPSNTRTLSDMKLIGVDHRNAPIAHVEPSATSILQHLEAAHALITKAHQLWNERARA